MDLTELVERRKEERKKLKIKIMIAISLIACLIFLALGSYIYYIVKKPVVMLPVKKGEMVDKVQYFEESGDEEKIINDLSLPYFIEIGKYNKPEDAAKKLAELKAEKISGEMIKESSLYKILLHKRFDTREKAQAYLNEIKAEVEIDNEFVRVN